jgi:hypothetical protein
MKLAVGGLQGLTTVRWTDTDVLVLSAEPRTVTRSDVDRALAAAGFETAHLA